MTEKDKLEIMRKAFSDVIWMAIRYAHGRHTYAPSMVREAIMNVRSVFPDFELKEDSTLETPDNLSEIAIKSDYLTDLFEKKATS